MESKKAVVSSGRYRLLGEHIIADRHYMAGVEVGTGTDILWPDDPTPLMEGLDAAGKKAVMDVHDRLYARLPPWETDEYKEKMRISEVLRKAQERETDSRPVSDVQAAERGKSWDGFVPARPVMTKGGDTVGGVGPAIIREE